MSVYQSELPKHFIHNLNGKDGKKDLISSLYLAYLPFTRQIDQESSFQAKIEELMKANNQLIETLKKKDEINEKLADSMKKKEEINDKLAETLKGKDEANTMLKEFLKRINEINSFSLPKESLKDKNELNAMLRESNQIKDENIRQIEIRLQELEKKYQKKMIFLTLMNKLYFSNLFHQ